MRRNFRQAQSIAYRLSCFTSAVEKSKWNARVSQPIPINRQFSQVFDLSSATARRLRPPSVCPHLGRNHGFCLSWLIFSFSLRPSTSGRAYGSGMHRLPTGLFLKCEEIRHANGERQSSTPHAVHVCPRRHVSPYFAVHGLDLEGTHTHWAGVWRRQISPRLN